MARTFHSYQRGYGYSVTDSDVSALWKNFPIVHDPRKVVYFYDDFLSVNIGDQSGWTLTNTNATVIQANHAGGAIAIGNTATDSDTANLVYKSDGNDATVNGGQFKMTENSGLPLWYECRFAVDDIAEFGFAFGLGTPNGAGEFLADDTLIPDPAVLVDGVYFDCGGATASAFNASCIKNGTADTEVIAGGITLTASATTYHTAGFYFDGADTVTYYFDDEPHATTTTPSTEADWPDDVTLAPFFATKIGTGDAASLYVDYVRIGQYRS